MIFINYMKVINEDLIKKVINRVLNEDTKKININDISGSSSFPKKNKRLSNSKYFIIHHTAGRGTANAVVRVLNSRKLGVQWVIDREGRIFQTLPMGGYGHHIKNSDNYPNAPKGINNSNAQGVEVIASNDSDILKVQALATLRLVKYLGFSPSQIYGHGEINPGHKSPSEGRTIKNFIKSNWNKLPQDYEFNIVDVDPSEDYLKPVKPAKTKEYMNYILATNKVYNPTKTWIRGIGDANFKSRGSEVYGVRRNRDNRVYLFKFDNNLNVYYVEMSNESWNDKNTRDEIVKAGWDKLTKTSIIKSPDPKRSDISTKGDSGETAPSSNGTPNNIIIGDSQTPYVDMNTSKAQRISNTGGKKSLWLGGMGVNWLRDAVKAYPVSENVKNVVICIGTNGGFGKYLNDDITGLFDAIRKTFPNAKTYAVQGSWGWGGLKGITIDDVKSYYDKYRRLGATIIEPPIGAIEPHGNKPIYKEIGASIDSKL